MVAHRAVASTADTKSRTGFGRDWSRHAGQHSRPPTEGCQTAHSGAAVLDDEAPQVRRPRSQASAWHAQPQRRGGESLKILLAERDDSLDVGVRPPDGSAVDFAEADEVHLADRVGGR